MSDPTENAAKWRPLEADERRVLGVLIEKAKTTPDNYPLSLNAVVTGANQKSNRFPQMQLEPTQVEETLDRLREYGAVAIIQGDGRVDKFRHLAYDWLGVTKFELAVMGELLLRGAQTLGELRGRAARMEPIKGLSELQPLLESLAAKRLVVHLSPPGRGAVVTHNLYQPRELEKVRREYGGGETVVAAHAASASPAATAPAAPSPTPAAGPAAAEGGSELRREMEALRTEFQVAVDRLEQRLDEIERQLGN